MLQRELRHPAHPECGQLDTDIAESSHGASFLLGNGPRAVTSP